MNSGAGPEFTFAFQPIVDSAAKRVISQEALIRGRSGESAWHILSQVTADKIHEFDHEARMRSLGLAVRLGLDCDLNLNFLPKGLEATPASIEMLLDLAASQGLDADRLVLEVTEGEVIADPAHFTVLINEYRSLGLKVAIDDFGAGYSGLNLLADFQPDQIKLDMKLVRDIESHGPRQAIVRAVNQVCLDLAIDVIAEGVETLEEYRWLEGEGMTLFQGYFFARPAFEGFGIVQYPERA